MAGSSFNDTIEQARAGLADAKPDKSGRFVAGVCVPNFDLAIPEQWPTLFAGIPRRGDFITSLSGQSTLEVKFVEHTLYNKSPVLRIHIGRAGSSDFKPGG